ncbi:MAG: polysaccharide deacetylase family protein [Candidatus Methylomirabilia bacterium]
MGWRRRHFRSAETALAVVFLLSLPLVTPNATAASRLRNRTPSFERGRRDLPKLALTFDGGSDAGESGRILDVLEQRGVTATFFLTGEYIRHNPGLVRRIAAGGHEVGNHTWSHPHLTSWDRTRRHDTLPGLDPTVIQEELNRTAQAYEAATGRTMTPLWRAPFGEVNDDLLLWAAAAGWRHVGWTRDEVGGRHTLDSLDWVAERSSRNYLTSEQIAARILSFGAGGSGLNGGVVLMHLSTRRDDPEVTRLGALVDALRGEGYRLVTVTELQRDAPSPAPLPPFTASLSRQHE